MVRNSWAAQVRALPFLEILDRLDWSCLVCLVGPGQEINRGEGGLPLWASALRGSRRRELGGYRRVAAIDGGEMVAGDGLASVAEFMTFRSPATPDYTWQMQSGAIVTLSMACGLRHFWKAISKRQSFGAQFSSPPAYLTRDLNAARAWLRERRKGGRSVGLLCSSGAVRLVGEGVPPAPRSNELDQSGTGFSNPIQTSEVVARLRRL